MLHWCEIWRVGERENQKLLLDLTFQMIRTQQQQKRMETEKIYYRNHNNTLNEQMKNATFTTKNLWLSNHTKPWVLHKDYLRVTQVKNYRLQSKNSL